MFKPVAQSLSRAGFNSNDSLAEALRKSAPQLPWPARRSLGSKIGELDLGRPVWWTRRPQHLEALASLLQLPVTDFGLHAAEERHLHAFTRFPELPALNLKKERPCEIAAPWRLGTDFRGEPYRESWHELAFWFAPGTGAAARPDRTVHWLHVPPGAGLNLLWQWLQVQGGGDFLEVDTLTQCSDRLSRPAPLAVRLNREEPDLDVTVLGNRHPDIAVLVVAAFAAQERSEADAARAFVSWEFLTADERRQKEMVVTEPRAALSGIQRYEWRLYPDWRERLLKWAEERIRKVTDETLLTAQGVKRWMSTFGPGLAQIRPADVMSLCHLCHSIPETALPKAGAKDAGERLIRHLTELRPSVAAQFTRLVRRRLADRRLPWGTALDAQKWADVLGSSEASLTEEDLRAIADAPSKTARHDMAMKLFATTRENSLHSLEQERMLVQAARNAYTLEPAFVADLVARDHIIQLIAHGDIETWGAFCFDPDRRRLVDAALRASPMSVLVDVHLQLEQYSFETPASLAAGEALFFALGHIAAQCAEVPRTVHKLCDRVLARLRLEDQWSVSFWTRSAEDRQGAAEHLLVLWSWSLVSEPPDIQLSNDLGWFFPGWFSDFSEAHTFDPVFSLPAPFSAPQDVHLLGVIEKIASALPPGNAEVPEFLLPFLIARSLRGETELMPQWLDRVVGKRELEDALLQGRWPSASIARLLPVFVQLSMDSTDDSRGVRYMFSPLRRWILQNTSATQAAELLNEPQRHKLWSEPAMLPQHLRAWILNAAEAGRHDGVVPAAIKNIGASEAGALKRWLDDDTMGARAAGRLWTVAPDIAAAMMASDTTGPTARLNLLWAAPEAELRSSIDVIRSCSDVIDAGWLQLWARMILPKAGTHAEAVLSLVLNRATTAGRQLETTEITADGGGRG